jgi:hypothetical protein
MFKRLFVAVVSVFCFLCGVSATEFSVASYNCGGLSDHYDYIRAACMHELMQARYNAEPAALARIERIQQLALKALFAKDAGEQSKARQMLEKSDNKTFFEKITAAPILEDSPNTAWFQKSEKMVTPYDVRPIDLREPSIIRMLTQHLQDLSRSEDESSDVQALLTLGRHIMAERIFRDNLKHDIICLQEADYLNDTMFPVHYEVAFSEAEHSVNAVAWNKERFQLIDNLGNIQGRGLAVKLLEIESGKVILVGTGHLTGCNPFTPVVNPETKHLDSDAGDNELKTIVQLFDNVEADVRVIAMDSNVTATHPRLKILKDYGYQIDSDNYFEQTCTNPYVIINTRIDWIALKSNSNAADAIINIPVLNVGLNNIQTNISDHKPIAALIKY